MSKYGVVADAIMRSAEPWQCFACRGECLCAQCRKRGNGLELEGLAEDDSRRNTAAYAAAALAAASQHLTITNPEQTLSNLSIVGTNATSKPIVPSRLLAASSGYRGVSTQGSRWRTRICVDKREYTVGDYATEVEAAQAYDREAIKHRKLKVSRREHSNIDSHLPHTIILTHFGAAMRAVFNRHCMY